jgi:DNA-nicking Smr family endonuclease
MSRKPPFVPDHSLWDEVRRTILPMGEKRRVSHTRSSHQAASFAATAKLPALAMVHRHEAPPLAAFDRRTAQKLARGQEEPEARIDLHGEGLEMARVKLYHFLQSRQQQGLRLVLVITGKGKSPYARHTLHTRELFHAPEREGRLRREVPLWMGEAQFRAHVVGFQPAHPRHGGGGAFYVRLRRQGRTP